MDRNKRELTAEIKEAAGYKVDTETLIDDAPTITLQDSHDSLFHWFGVIGHISAHAQ